MRYFVKINLASAIYALPIFVAVQLTGNVYRISRLTGWEPGTVDRTITWINIAGFLVWGVIFMYINKRLLEEKAAGLWSVLAWFLYFIVYVYVWTSLYPITLPEDSPAPVSGLIMIGMLFLHFLLLAVIQAGSLVWKRASVPNE